VNQMTRATKVEMAMSLGAEVVREARALPSDIAGTIEKLLMEFIARERSKGLGRNRAVIPYVVNVQTSRLDTAHTRIVNPLIGLPRPGDIQPRLTTAFVIQAETLFLDPMSMFAAPVSALGPVAGSFAADAMPAGSWSRSTQ
jgi:hypothetical protein